MAKSKKDKSVFHEAISNLHDNFGLEWREAVYSVQDDYAKFKNRNQKLLERQNDQSNVAQVQLISHFALLATLTLTVVGFFITQSSQTLTGIQQFVVVLIMLLEITSLGFGAYDYIQTINFHKKWAIAYKHIEDRINQDFESAKLQKISHLNDIENEIIDPVPQSTKIWVTYAMVGFCMAGLLLILALALGYFYDIPLVK